jgi:ABC-2 type transport system permease protein
MNLRTVLTIARKDVLDAVRNRYLFLSMILPIGMSVVFRLVFGGGTGVEMLRVAVYDPGSSRITAGLQEIPDLNLVEVDSENGLWEEVEDDASAGILVPPDFDAAMDAGNRPELTVYMNRGRGGSEQMMVREIVYQQIWALGEDSTPADVVWKDSLSPIEEAEGGAVREDEFRIESYLLVMFLMMSLTMTGTLVVPLLLVEEKEKHTMEFLLVSPAAPAEIAAGKALTGMAYAGLSAGVLLALNGGGSGNWPATIVALFLGALFLVMIGLLEGSLLHTTMQINTWSPIIILVLLAPSMLGVIRLPAAIDAVVRAVPTYYLANLLEESLSGRTTPAEAAAQLAILAGGAAAVFAAVVWVIRQQER